jgi:hypothetical protein
MRHPQEGASDGTLNEQNRNNRRKKVKEVVDDGLAAV